MKTKTFVLATLIFVVVVGLGAWLFFSLQQTSVDKEPAGQTDTVKPVIRLNIPASSLQLAATDRILEVSAEASDNKMITEVEYLLDGKVAARSVEEPNFKVTINLASLSMGEHTLQAVAHDAAGNVGKSEEFVFLLEEAKIEPADDTSQEIIEGSSSTTSRSRTAGQTVGQSGSSNGNGSQNDGGNGGNPDPDPDPDPERTAGGWYASLPARMQVCSNNVWNEGPSSAPTNAITVPAGDNAGFNFNQTDKTFWFAPGVHTIGSGEFSNIVAGAGSTYIGAPGAIIDGQFINKYAFTGFATDVRVAYLEIRNFGVDLSDPGVDEPVNNNEGVINHDAGDGWTMEYINAHHNDGAAIFMGSDNVVSNNCMKDNGQYGFSMFKMPMDGDSAIKDIVIDNNEIAGNNQDDWEDLIDGCGCTGAGKFWDVEGATVTNNYVHDNLSTGLWADTNDIDFLFDSNWIEHNSGEGIWYEISYNATISRNVIKRNAWESGNNNTGSPGAAVYISESGGDDRLQGTVSGSTDLRINNNLMENNFSGISIYENSNRFCNSNGNTSKGYCTPFVSPTLIPEPHDFDYPNPISATHACYTNIGSQPYTTDCRWHSKDVQVFNNEFRFDEDDVPCAGTFCGVHALFATGSNNIPWAPAAYNIGNIQNDVMFNNNNKFYNNAYFGRWRFAKGSGEKINYGVWQAAPFSQDNGSTYVADPIPNALDDDTATLEGSIGRWAPWFSASFARSSAEAHTGSYSLEATITSGGSWGAEANNFPGFETSAGPKRISFWAKQGVGAVPNASFRAYWYDSNQNLLNPGGDPDIVAINSLTTNWQEGTADFTAPAGTASVFIRFVGTSGTVGHTLYADDFKIADLQ
jgi:hypothetical protein